VGATADLPRQDANAFIADYVAGLEGYTYLEDEGVPAEVLVDSVNSERSTVNGTAGS
jgi:hypothetical protein